MRTPLQNIVATQLSSLSGFGFQDFIKFLMRIHYGNDAVQELRSVKDEGADCLISSCRICIACYAPEKKVSANIIIQKLRGDFDSYKTNWQVLYPTWHFYTNLEPSPEQVKLVATWGSKHKLHGSEHILFMVETDSTGSPRKYPDRYRIYQKLNIGKEYLGRDFLNTLLNDLISGNYLTDKVRSLSEAPEIIRKLRANSTEAEHREFEARITATYELQIEVEQVLRSYDTSSINTIKNIIVQDYYNIVQNDSTASEFQRMKRLIEKYEWKYNGELKDDMLSAYIAALVWYVFSQCHIGNKP
ncbi:MAG: hypothetical protein Q4C79_04530 [Neisseria sp.]|uniref:hypothetical protein n=1 Tax=Neisseria sp. TaxID=192066 RepID=UPI0026DD3EB0|nr:hypothetical protein [Neisseria sp.]MDO4248220.1 hypothetical protein [Neisseria sp.]